MTGWTTEVEWETDNGVSHRIEERYNRRKSLYEVRLSLKAGETWFIRDRWMSEDGVNV